MGLTAVVQAAFASINLTYILAFLVITFTTVYWMMTRRFGKFEAKGLKSIKPEFFYGNGRPLIEQTKSLMDFHKDLYNAFPNEK